MASKKTAVAKAKSKALSNKEAGAIVQRLERAHVVGSGQKSVRLGSSRDPRGKNRLVSGPDGTGRLTRSGKFIPKKGVSLDVKVGKRASKKRAGAGKGGRSNK